MLSYYRNETPTRERFAIASGPTDFILCPFFLNAWNINTLCMHWCVVCFKDMAWWTKLWLWILLTKANKFNTLTCRRRTNIISRSCYFRSLITMSWGFLWRNFHCEVLILTTCMNSIFSSTFNNWLRMYRHILTVPFCWGRLIVLSPTPPPLGSKWYSGYCL